MFFIALLVLFACKKSEDRNCWKFTGDTTTKEIVVPTFNKIKMGPHLRYTLVQDSVEKVILTGGENVVNLIETSVVDGLLTIQDNNKCRFLREESKSVHVEIHIKKIINIEFEGTEEVVCQNQLVTDYLTLHIRDGSGKFNLNVNADLLYAAVTHGWGNFSISGNVNYFNVEVRNNGFGNAYNLHVKDSVHAISRSTETIKINVDSCAFKAQTHSSGSIWYQGTPLTTEFFTYGTGEILDKN